MSKTSYIDKERYISETIYAIESICILGRVGEHICRKFILGRWRK